MAKINPYINFNGNTEEAFGFYKSVFGGEFMGGIMRWKDMPQSEEGCAGAEEGRKLTEAEGEKVMHISLPIGGGNILMGSDSIEGFGPNHLSGNNFSLSLNTESREETERLFAALSEGGTTTMPLADSFWNSYFGMCVDKFGINWLFNYEYNQEKQ
jgi:PhnB protein